jgi:hypothetical protein
MGDLQIWRVATNIMNKQLQTADRRWTFNLGVGGGTNILSAWKTVTQLLGLGRIPWNGK